MSLIHDFKNALIACLFTFAICVVLYPGVVYAIAQIALPRQAEGSLIVSKDQRTIGSQLIGQPFVSDSYFQPRPSAADYKADAASGSNLGPHNPDLKAKVSDRAAKLGATSKNPAPVDLVTASGSGLDPHISPEGAYYQVERVAKARGLSAVDVRALVTSMIETGGMLIGAPERVNVLLLNQALDERRK